MGMSKRLDLINNEQEGTSHQAALVIGGISAINTRAGYRTGNIQDTRYKERRNAEIRGRKCPKARLQQRERKAGSKGGDKGQKGRRGAKRQGV
jgi:hypothetical protein